MPKALAIETSGRAGSLAILDDQHVVGEDHFPHGLQNAALMIPRIDALCKAKGWAPNEVDEIYVSVGPGSFTGLRIGVTLAKTLSLVTGARLVAVPSVRVLARNAPPDAQNLIIVLDAKRGQIFTARFERQPQGWSEREPAHLDDLKSMLARSPRPVCLLGEGIPFHHDAIPAGDHAITLAPADLWHPRARALAEEGFALARQSRFTHPDRLTPFYIRRPEAEEVWDRKHAGT
jgi:tRNA threonylcarbamoyladenosine biosynthesis protein TsaB